MVSPIPEGTHTITPHLIVRGGDRAIGFYEKAFGAVEVMRMPAPGGSIMHAELRIGDSPMYLADENPAWGALSPLALGGSPVTIHLYVPDVDASFERAILAGATVRMPLSDAFWGDRYGQLGDPFGHVWAIATHTEDLSPEEVGRRAGEAFASGPAPQDTPEPLPEPVAGEEPRRAAPRPAPRRQPARTPPKKKVAKKKVAKKKVAKKKVARRKPAGRAAKKPATRKKVGRKPAKKSARKTPRKRGTMR